MKVIHDLGYDNCFVSAVFRQVRVPKRGDELPYIGTVHHVIRDGHAQIFWFTVWQKDIGYVEIDIRELLEKSTFDLKDFMGKSNRKRLEFVAEHIQGLVDAGGDFVAIVRAVNEASFPDDDVCPF